MKIKRRQISLLIVTLFLFSNVPALSEEICNGQIVLNDDIIISDVQEVSCCDVLTLPYGGSDLEGTRDIVYTYENGVVVQSYEATNETLELAAMHTKPHVHSLCEHSYALSAHGESDAFEPFHIALRCHSHWISNTTSSTWNFTRAVTDWSTNRHWPNEISWPQVTWTQGESFGVSTSLSLSVGVTAGVVEASIGSSFTTSHTITATQGHTFRIPYRREGRVVVRYQRPRRDFTTWTRYYSLPCHLFGSIHSTVSGVGSALGAPSNIRVDVELRNLSPVK